MFPQNSKSVFIKLLLLCYENKSFGMHQNHSLSPEYLVILQYCAAHCSSAGSQGFRVVLMKCGRAEHVRAAGSRAVSLPWGGWETPLQTASGALSFSCLTFCWSIQLYWISAFTFLFCCSPSHMQIILVTDRQR